MAAMRCLASLQQTLWSRSSASAQHLRPASLVQWIPGAALQRQRASAPRLRVLSGAAQPYWQDDTRQEINVYSSYTVYKGKSAMALKVIKPTWDRISSGLRLVREGTVLLEFAHAVGQQKYDWEKKESFALSAVECAAVLEATDARKDLSLYHDPNKGGPLEGQVSKTLKVAPATQGWFITLNVNSGGSKSSVFCNLTEVELRLIKTLMAFLIPRLLGFDEQFAGPAPTVASEDNGGAAAAAPPEGPPF